MPTTPSTAHNQSVIVCEHPVLQHNLAILRDANTSHERFRSAVSRVSNLLLQEATRGLAR